jgi:DNA-binding phage protein
MHITQGSILPSFPLLTVIVSLNASAQGARTPERIFHHGTPDYQHRDYLGAGCHAWLPAPQQAALVREARGCISAVPGLSLSIERKKEMTADTLAARAATDAAEPHRDSVLEVMAASMIGTAIE